MTTAKRLHYEYDEYLRLLEQSDFKLEYCDGVIYAMAGGTAAHAMLCANAIRLIGQLLLGSGRVFSSDLKVRIDASGLSTFPDASVVCGPAQMSGLDRNALVNPSVLVEVTSRSTEDYDRGDKLSHYKQLESLRAVVFISHRTRCVTVVERTDSGWEEKEIRGGEHVTLSSPQLHLLIDELYAGVTLDPK